MENFSLDELARRSFNEDDSLQQNLIDALEIAICALSKSPAATWCLLIRLCEAYYEAEKLVNNKPTD